MNEFNRFLELPHTFSVARIEFTSINRWYNRVYTISFLFNKKILEYQKLCFFTFTNAWNLTIRSHVYPFKSSAVILFVSWNNVSLISGENGEAKSNESFSYQSNVHKPKLSSTFYPLPGIPIRFLFNSNKSLEFKVKAYTPDEARSSSGQSLSRHKKNYGHYLQIALPFTILPAVLFSSFLPFLIPVLKLGTIFVSMINNTALLASLMYFIRQIALETEQKQTIYFNPGYN